MIGPRAILSWKDDTGGGEIRVDVIPSLENSLSSSVTEFPLEDGSIVNEHIIHRPETLTLEIAQTQIPFEDSDDDGNDIEFVKASMALELPTRVGYEKASYPLDLPKTRFQAKGMLFLLLQAEGVLGAVTGAIGSLLGIGGGAPTNQIEGLRRVPAPAPAVQIELFRPPYEGKDRINDLYDKLASARMNGAEMTLDWLGRRWTSYYIEQIVYSRKKGRELGEFAVALKQVVTVSTATATLASPSEARLKAGLNAGNKPAKKSSDTEKDAAAKAAKNTALKQVKDKVLEEGLSGVLL
jgi:hypothetical protein